MYGFVLVVVLTFWSEHWEEHLPLNLGRWSWLYSLHLANYQSFYDQTWYAQTVWCTCTKRSSYHHINRCSLRNSIRSSITRSVDTAPEVDHWDPIMGCCFSFSNGRTATPSLAPTPSHPPCSNRSNHVLETSDTSIPDLALPPCAFDYAATHTFSHPPYTNGSYYGTQMSGTNMLKIT